MEILTQTENTQTPEKEADSRAVVIRDLKLAYGDKHVLDGVNLTIEKGAIVAIMGPSGCGKSTLLKVVSGLLAPDEGKMELFVEKPAMSFQNGALFTSMTVAENIDVVLKHNTSLKQSERRKRIDEVLALVGLDGEQDSYPSELSGGMNKRAGIARAIAVEPDLILHDEPSTGLDPIMAEKLNYDLRKISRDLKMTTLLVTHDLNSIRTLPDRVVMLWQGKVQFEGTADEFFSTDNDYAVQFRECREEGPMDLMNGHRNKQKKKDKKDKDEVSRHGKTR